MKYLALLATLSIAFQMTHADEPTFEAKQVNNRLSFRQFTPEIEPEKRYPVVLFLHGAGERGDDNKSQLKHGAGVLASPKNQQKHPSFVVAPQCPRNEFWSGQNLADAIDIIKTLAKDPRVDPKRLYITGLSMGGYGTWSALASKPTLFAAAIPICGGGSPETAGRFAKIPIWIFHGSADKIVPAKRSHQMMEALNDVGAKNAQLTIYDGVGHDSWTRTYNDPKVLDWLFSQSR